MAKTKDEPVMASNDLAEKYRPKRLKEVLGHDAAVDRIRGMLQSGDIPGAFLFMGPTSAGKTTLARVLAAEINRKSVAAQGSDYKEENAASARTIEDMRDLIKLSKFRPTNKKRIIVIDEAQQLITNATAAQAILKPLEDASKTDTIWILCTMDPTKFTSGTGKAIAGRCAQFVLKESDNSALLKQAIRIRDGEGMKYMAEDALKQVVKASNNQMRALAHLMKSVKDTYEGMAKKPKTIGAESVAEILAASESNDDAMVVSVIVNTLAGKYGLVHRALLDVAEPFPFINKLLWAAQFQLNVAVLDGKPHRKVWWNATNKAISADLKKNGYPTLGQLGALNEMLVQLKQVSAAFAVGEIELISARIYRFIVDNVAKKKKE